MTTTTDTDPLLAARAAVAKLTVQQKAQLVSELVQEIAAAVVAPMAADA